MGERDDGPDNLYPVLYFGTAFRDVFMIAYGALKRMPDNADVRPLSSDWCSRVADLAGYGECCPSRRKTKKGASWLSFDFAGYNSH